MRLISILLVWTLCHLCSSENGPQCPTAESLDPCRCRVVGKLPRTQKLWLSCSGLQSPGSLRKVIKAMNGTKVILKIEESWVTNFTEETFRDLVATDLFISSTNLTSISDGKVSAFEAINGLQFLGINKCSLKDKMMEEGHVGDIKSLQILNVNDNHLQRVRQLWFEHGKYLSLTQIFMRRNQISTVESRSFRNLQNLHYLDLSENRISILKDDLFPKHLTSLMMSYNEIEVLPDDFFGSTQSLVFLALDHNNLSALKEEVWEELYNRDTLHKLDLRANPLACDCALCWKADSRQEGPMQFEARCHSPEALKGRPLASIRRRRDLGCDCDHRDSRYRLINRARSTLQLLKGKNTAKRTENGVPSFTGARAPTIEDLH